MKYPLLVNTLLALPPSDWPIAISALSKTDGNIDSLRAELDDTAERCAYLAEYISQHHGLTGTGPKTHPQAAKAARRQMIKVSKALGYGFAESRAFNL
jgi:hypothetical protein